MRQRQQLIFVVSMMLFFCAALSLTVRAQLKGTESPRPAASARISWTGRPGVSRYRLQLSRDAAFNDIVFDQAVIGREYVVTGLPAGRYYWHVAPAAAETGSFSQSLMVEVSSRPVIKPLVEQRRPEMPAMAAESNGGWRAATGHISQPLIAPLRTASGSDLIGVNADGMVYALDGASGLALWTARYKPDARRGEQVGRGTAPLMTPVLVHSPRGLVNVLVAFDGGVRELDGATGRELWRASLPGRALSGTFANPDGRSPQAFLIDTSRTLSILDGVTGQIISQARLDGRAIGSPAAFATRSAQGVVLALDGGILDVRNNRGERVRSVKLDANITTPPLVMQTSRLALVLIGTDRGLIALEAPGLRPVWRVATNDDTPQGALTLADLDGDDVPEVVMLTRRGRVVSVHAASGKIHWYTEGATDAVAPAFADVNGDGTPDVLVASGTAFAIGFNGRDGSQVWKADDAGGSVSNKDAAVTGRALVVSKNGSGATAFVIGSDIARTGLRAIGLPKGAQRAATR